MPRCCRYDTRQMEVPNGVQRYFELLKIINDLTDLRPVGIAPTALMISKHPVLLHRWEARSARLERSRNISGSWARGQIQVDTSAKRTPCDVVGTKQDLLAVRVSVVYSV